MEQGLSYMNLGPFNHNVHDSKGFKDDETEAFREMHDTRMQFNAKFTCLGYALLLIGAVAFGIYLYFFG